jgi:type IV pilus assembly protein PilB
MADLGKYLVGRGIIGPEQLTEAQAIAKKNGGKVHEILIKQGYASSEQVMQAMADMHGYEFFDSSTCATCPSRHPSSN